MAARSRAGSPRVGESGRVVAADLDVRLLEEGPNLEVLQIDLEQEDLPEAAFDFVHTRMLLLHLPGREALLARLAAAVRPGGVLLVEEDDIHPILATAERPVPGGVVGVPRRDAPGWGRPGVGARLPERLDGLGLVDVGAELRGQFFRGGSPAAEFWSLTWLQMRDRIVATGTPGQVVDAGRAALADHRRWLIGPATAGAWGRRAARSSTM